MIYTPAFIGETKIESIVKRNYVATHTWAGILRPTINNIFAMPPRSSFDFATIGVFATRVVNNQHTYTDEFVNPEPKVNLLPADYLDNLPTYTYRNRDYNHAIPMVFEVSFSRAFAFSGQFIDFWFNKSSQTDDNIDVKVYNFYGNGQNSVTVDLDIEMLFFKMG